MFKNLRTGTKLIILCSTFIVAIAVTLYALVAEKRIAIEFARKEVVGNRYIAAVRDVCGSILAAQAPGRSGAEQAKSLEQSLAQLSEAGAAADPALDTGEFREALTARVRELATRKSQGASTDALVLDALGHGQRLALRIGDASNLTLDPDLDSYYVQNIVVTKLPLLLRHLTELHALRSDGAKQQVVSASSLDGRFVGESLLRSDLEELASSFAAAYRGNPAGSVEATIDGAFRALLSNVESYLQAWTPAVADAALGDAELASLDSLFSAATASAIPAWSSAQVALNRLLRERIERLRTRMGISLGLSGALAGLSILIALMTHWHIVRPLQRLEQTASNVRETKNYNVRVGYSSEDEIGRVSVAFDDMLSELAAARARELSKQAEMARVTRLTTMGQMAASIAHEISQPLAAIVTGSNAAQRWLNRKTPDLEEARAALQRIASDGHRASQVIARVRAMLKTGAQERLPTNVNALIREVLALAQADLQSRKITVRTELAEPLPPVLADSVQLQQVLLNLITNAADAMSSVTDRVRLLRVMSGSEGPDGIKITVHDNGTGIDPDDRERIFDAFFTTKSHGMGLGLAICRSIVEAHGGQLSALPADSHGSVMQIMLPHQKPEQAA